MGTDAEELTADSDAAMAQSADLKKRLKSERAENERKLKEAGKAREDAAKKREQASVQLKHDTAELDQILRDRKRAQNEIAKLNTQNAAADKAMADSKAKLERARKELSSLNEQKAARAKQLFESQARAKKAEADREKAQSDLKRAKSAKLPKAPSQK